MVLLLLFPLYMYAALMRAEPSYGALLRQYYNTGNITKTYEALHTRCHTYVLRARLTRYLSLSLSTALPGRYWMPKPAWQPRDSVTSRLISFLESNIALYNAASQLFLVDIHTRTRCMLQTAAYAHHSTTRSTAV